MIVVIGELAGRRRDASRFEPGGPAARVAVAAAEAGATVEIVTRVGDDPEGDSVVLALAHAGVGHVATIRDAGHRTRVLPETTDSADPVADAATAETSELDARPAPAIDAADVGLALRYLGDYRVIVLLHPGNPAILREAAAAARWASAHLVVVTLPGSDPVGDVPAGTLAMTADQDAESVAGLLGRYAAAVDRGEEPVAAYAALTRTLSEG